MAAPQEVVERLTGLRREIRQHDYRYYVLDEPSIGLHARDNRRLIEALLAIRDLGNTVIVVEHDEEAIMSADFVVDLGPGAGVHGGHVVAAGSPAEVQNEPRSLTGQYLSGKRAIEVPATRTPSDPQKQIRVLGATGNNLQGVDASIPVGLMTCVTGVSGSGKTSLVFDTLYHEAKLDPTHNYVFTLERGDDIRLVDFR